jgi:hypothetical protein
MFAGVSVPTQVPFLRRARVWPHHFHHHCRRRQWGRKERAWA